jgi:uncharacterized delta-60 repeat protein
VSVLVASGRPEIEPEPPVVEAASGAALVGRLDASFGNGGSALVQRTAGEQRFSSVTVLDDGSVVGCGYAPFDGQADIAVAKLTPSGKLDEGFGESGWVRVGKTRGFGGAVAHDGQGRVLAAGYFYRGGGTHLLLARLDARGRFDPSFGKDGIVIYDGGKSDQPHAIFVTREQRVLVVGYHEATKNAALAFTSSGTLDRGWGDAGVATFGGDKRSFATAAALDSQGGVVAGGYLPQERRGFVARLGPDGRPDVGFGENGFVILERPSMSSAWAVAVDEGGRVLLGGHTDQGSAAVVRFSPDGRLDPTWGDRGVALVDPTADDQLYALLFDAQRRVIGVGFRDLAEDARALVVRFSERGRVDPAFGEQGLVVESLSGGTFLFDAVWDGRGRLVAAGDVWNLAESRALVVRLN